MKSTIFLTILLLFAGCHTTQQPLFTVAAAANVQFAMQDIVAEFEKIYGHKVNLVIGSSGKLTAQIQQGAPYSIFLSADKKYPTLLFEKKKAIHLPEVYMVGKLALWSNSNFKINDLNELKNPDIKRIAIANPLNAPYGQEAENALKYYQLWDAVQPKLVFGESIAQTNQYILSGACEVGFTALSTAFAKDINHRGHWLPIDEKSYKPIEQGAVITAYGEKYCPEISKKFYQFLFSDAAKTIFTQFGQ